MLVWTGHKSALGSHLQLADCERKFCHGGRQISEKLSMEMGLMLVRMDGS
jgi:hypothetical protein